MLLTMTVISVTPMLYLRKKKKRGKVLMEGLDLTLREVLGHVRGLKVVGTLV